jgi:hypothetical protein
MCWCLKLTDTIARASLNLQTIGQGLSSTEVDEVGSITGSGQNQECKALPRRTHVLDAAWPASAWAKPSLLLFF